jgi:hypothetical protein
MLATARCRREVPAGVTSEAVGTVCAGARSIAPAPPDALDASPPPRMATIAMATTAVRNTARDIPWPWLVMYINLPTEPVRGTPEPPFSRPT